MKTSNSNLLNKDVMGARIYQLRTEKRMTQVALAKELKVSRTILISWEKGMCLPSMQNILYMSKYFAVPADYILGTGNRRYKIPSEFDLTKLNNEGVRKLYEQYELLVNSDKYKA